MNNKINMENEKMHDKILTILKSYSSIIDFDEDLEAFNLLNDLTDLFKEEMNEKCS